MQEPQGREPAGDAAPTSEHARRRWARGVGWTFIALVVCVCVLLAGVFARQKYIVWFLDAPPPVQMQADNAEQMLRSHPTRFWALERDLDGLVISGVAVHPNGGEGARRSFSASTNAMGLRNAAVGPKAGRLRILAIGDSTTFGDWVNNDEAWPQRLQALLDPSGETIEVINAGVPGYSAYQGLQFLKEDGLALEPDVVIASFGINDHVPWDGISDLDRAEAATQGDLDELVKAAKGEERPRLSPDEFLRVIETLEGLCGEHGIAFVLVAWPESGVLSAAPDVGDVGYLRFIRQAGERMGVPVADIVPVLRANPEFLIDGCHFNAAGCRSVAETIAGLLSREGLLPEHAP